MRVPEEKQRLRDQVRKLRRQVDAEHLSQRILETLQSLDCWRRAQVVLLYVGVRDEVRTLNLLESLLKEGRRVALPWCDGPRLELCEVRSLEDLSPGAFGIPEPDAALRLQEQRRVLPVEIELAVVPGLAFDRQGGRIGYGRGFYDGLLLRLPRKCPRVGLAFSCQLVECVPCEPHDERLDLIVTEDGIVPCPPRPGGAVMSSQRNSADQ